MTWDSAAARAREINTSTAKLRFARRRLGMLRPALRARPDESPLGRPRLLLETLARLEGDRSESEWTPLLRGDAGLAELLGLVSAAQAEAERLAAEHRAERRAQWHLWCSDQWAAGGRLGTAFAQSWANSTKCGPHSSNTWPDSRYPGPTLTNSGPHSV